MIILPDANLPSVHCWGEQSGDKGMKAIADAILAALKQVSARP